MTISVTDLHLKGGHGMYEEELILQNDFLLNVELQYIPGEELIESINDTINYVRVYEILKQEFDVPAKLLETLVMRMASRIKSEFQQVKNISIHIKKLHPPIEKFNGNVGVNYEVIY